MADQAHGLRLLAGQSRNEANSRNSILVRPRRSARTIAVTSGKGGVGKTNFCANLALLLAKSGQRVVILDADLGLANLHVVLGVTPQYHLGHVIRGERTLAEVLATTPDGIGLIAGGSGVTELANLDQRQVQGFISKLAEIDDIADVLLIDTGAGLSDNVMAFVLAAEEIIVVTTPEPTALADGYATVKVVSRENPDSQISVVVNMAASEAEADATGERLRLVAKQFLDVDLDVLGSILQDPAVPRAVRAQRPVILECPTGPTARALGKMVSALGYRTGRQSGVFGFLNRLSRVIRPAGMAAGQARGF